MHSLIESFRSALLSIKAHGFRSFLTTLGIIIGVASVIAVVSVVQGLSYSINSEFQNLGSNTLTVRAYTPLKEALKGKIAKISLQDFEDIKARVSEVDAITPIVTGFGKIREVKFGSQVEISNVIGTNLNYRNVNSLYIEQGRFLSYSDDRKRRRVAVIGQSLIKALSLPQNPLGEYIQVGSEWFKVVGVTESKGEIFGIDQDNILFIPFSTIQSLIGRQSSFQMDIQLSLTNTDTLETSRKKISQILRQNHKLEASEADDFKIQTAEQLRSSFTSIIDSITVVLGGIVSISLLVGGIGIMNIMLVSVTERTREIGICKAIGAKRHHILLQFLIESVVLSLLGGVLGIIIGYGLGMLASAVIPNFPAANVPFWAIAVAFGFSAGIGVLFGILPAAKAANLKPIDALRYE
ncbi:ABC transporter permease [Pleionea litopenaei]|uniref:ABC transporter permease n=1 Tax=Pleionea litopenaei TaxID=3070815 RepID=A0AA51X844_9GAMM|nr:ABC transporter permease [Pleionea sp. HL-JVS1]WMS88556.1 ABC transporter permease [Pleionea sp. HL-JVS1]